MRIMGPFPSEVTIDLAEQRGKQCAADELEKPHRFRG
jgi:hypothetical protein